VNKGHRYRQPGIDVRFLRGDPAKIVQPRQTDVLDDKIELGEVGSSIIDVVDIERVGAQRATWALPSLDRMPATRVGIVA